MGLPNGYIQLAYIQSSGTQIIDTEVFANQNFRIVIDFEILSQGSLDYIFGARSSGNTKMFELAVQGSTWYSGFGTGNVQPSFSGLGHYVVDKNKNVTIINGSSSSSTENEFTTDYSVKLFGLDNAGTIGYYSIIKLKSCQIYDDTILIRNFTPCISPSWEVGLYEAIESKFYGNEGTGVFYAGPRKVNLPDGYTQLEYIQSSGTQYMDSGLIGNQNTCIDADYENSINYGAIISADSSWGSRMCTIETHFAAFADSNYHYDTIPNGRHTVSLNKGALSLDGDLLTTMSGTFTTPVNMAIFAMNRNGTIQEHGSITLHSLRIKDNETIVRDYIPCKNPFGDIGLYDTVASVYYQNIGTGAFAAGPEVEWPSLDAIYVKVSGVWHQIDSIKIL